MAPVIPWTRLPRLTRAEDLIDRHAAGAVLVHGIDQTAADIRNRFAAFSVPLPGHPSNVYAALATLDVLSTGCDAALANRIICEHGHSDAISVVRGLELIVASYAPVEARA
jgi:hypothetical protein